MMLDFKLAQTLKLSAIDRWLIVDMSRKQSVAEHSYNVAMISVTIADNIHTITSQSIYEEIMYWSLVHDLPEMVTGDIPTTMKKYIDANRMADDLYPLWKQHKNIINGSAAMDIVKAADYLDAIQFAQKYCVDVDKVKIIKDIQSNLMLHLNKVQNKELRNSVKSIMKELKCYG